MTNNTKISIFGKSLWTSNKVPFFTTYCWTFKTILEKLLLSVFDDLEIFQQANLRRALLEYFQTSRASSGCKM